MKTFAHVLNGRLHWKFESEEKPEFAPDFELIDITGVSPAPVEGDHWDGEKFSPPAPPSKEQRAALLKGTRDALVTRTDWLVQRHRDELDMKRETTLSSSEYDELLAYRQALRDFPSAADFPDAEMPAIPAAASAMLDVEQ